MAALGWLMNLDFAASRVRDVLVVRVTRTRLLKPHVRAIREVHPQAIDVLMVAGGDVTAARMVSPGCDRLRIARPGATALRLIKSETGS